MLNKEYIIFDLLPYLPVGTTPNQVVHAWNAMILDFPIARLAFLEQLKQTKKVYLLSNTNEIHIQAVNRSLQAVTHHSLDYFFDKVYLSHEVNMRKPHAEIFEFVCRDIGIMPQEALFIDDTIRHVEGAKKVGLVAHHLHQQDIVELGLI